MQLVNTWNGLPSRYWEKVLDNVQASLNGMILRDGGVNKGPAVAIDTRGITYNRAAMDALLEEPAVEQPNFTGIEIPAAKDAYFIAEDGVGVDEDHKDDREPEEEAVEAEEEGAVDAEEAEEAGQSEEGGESQSSGESAEEESEEGEGN